MLSRLASGSLTGGNRDVRAAWSVRVLGAPLWNDSRMTVLGADARLIRATGGKGPLQRRFPLGQTQAGASQLAAVTAVQSESSHPHDDHFCIHDERKSDEAEMRVLPVLASACAASP